MYMEHDESETASQSSIKATLLPSGTPRKSNIVNMKQHANLFRSVSYRESKLNRRTLRLNWARTVLSWPVHDRQSPPGLHSTRRLLYGIHQPLLAGEGR